LFLFGGVDRYASDEISVLVDWTWLVFVPREESSFSGIFGFEDYGEMGLVDPSFLPVDAWLDGSKPRVS